MNWLWYAVGAAVVIPVCLAHARARYRRWVRRHSYVATIEIREGSGS
jgi:4-amino-4-deoxy-L-arabinose transferase-like glycosyltransferase